MAQVLHTSGAGVGIIDPDTDTSIGGVIGTTDLTGDKQVEDGQSIFRPFTDVVQKWRIKDLSLQASLIATSYNSTTPVFLTPGDELVVLKATSPQTTLSFVDPSTMTVTATMTTNNHGLCQQMTMSDSSTLWLATTNTSSRAGISQIDVTTRTVTNTYNLSSVTSFSDCCLYYGGDLYVSVRIGTGVFDANPDLLLKVSITTGAVIGTCTLPNQYRVFNLLQAGGYLFTSSPNTADVYRIDPSSMTIADTYTASSADPTITTDGISVWMGNAAIRKIVGSTGSSTVLTQTGSPFWMSGDYEFSTITPRGLGGWGVGETKGEQ